MVKDSKAEPVAQSMRPLMYQGVYRSDLVKLAADPDVEELTSLFPPKLATPVFIGVLGPSYPDWVG